MQFWPFASKPEKAEILSGHRSQELLLLCHSDDGDGLIILENLCQLFAFAKLPFTVLDLQRQSAWPELDDFCSVVLCTQLLEIDAGKAQKIKRYVEQGGGLFVAFRGWNDHLQDLFGISAFAGPPKLHDTTGIIFTTELLPGLGGLKLEPDNREFDHSRLDLPVQSLEKDCQILVTDLDGRPIAWSRRPGAGCIVFWNTNVLFSRVMRGMTLHTLLLTMGRGVAAVAGFAMLHIDDFPPSLSDSRPEPLSKEFPGLDWNSFMFDVWHEDMMTLRQKHGLKYTWYAVMNYHDVATEPGAGIDAPDVVSGWEVLRQRIERIPFSMADDEYGFHGYNHQPLTKAYWPDLEVLLSKLQVARQMWQKTVPAPLPSSWVPANNWYHPEQLAVLEDVFPEITFLCSVHSSGDRKSGGGREFGAEPWSKSSVCLPRETYGYVLDPEGDLMTLSQIGGLGIWTHFIHPDDLFDIPNTTDSSTERRNPAERYWRMSNDAGLPGLLTSFENWIKRVGNLFPWLEYVTTSQAGERLRLHMKNRVEVSTSRDDVKIVTENGGLFFIRLRDGETIHTVSGGEVVDRRAVEQGTLNVVRCEPGTAIFRIGT